MLVPMSEETFRRFVAEEIEEYAQSNVKSGRWGPEVALDTAKREFNRLLPQGQGTPTITFCRSWRLIQPRLSGGSGGQ